jgi:DNA-binding NarL/FixJ family response regulator
MSDLSARTAVIVDGHPLWLDALERLLDGLRVEVVGRATRARDAEPLIAEHGPDLLVTDYATMARAGDGSSPSWSALVQAKHANPDVKCVVLSESDDPREREQAFAAGATVFCIKRAEPDDLASAIRQSFEHSIYFAKSEFVSTMPERPAAPSATESGAGLTKREVEILRLVAEGHSNSQLAKMLWVTEQTVKFHLSNIYRKLNVANRTEASRWAQRHGMLDIREAEPAVA